MLAVSVNFDLHRRKLRSKATIDVAAKGFTRVLPQHPFTLVYGKTRGHLFSDNDADQRAAEEIQLRLLGA
jgi:hypothetical protein